jgi:TIR domain/Effector-associated domain 9
VKDFFVSYNRADRQWAEWIAWTLEEAGMTVVIQAWDFRPGGNFVLDMQRAAVECKRTIAVLSETYLKSAFTQPEWAAAFVGDPQSIDRKLLPVKVKNCKPDGLLGPIVYVDLVGRSAVEAKQALLDALPERAKPETSPDFPGAEVSAVVSQRAIAEPKAFPSALSQVQKVKEAGLQQQLDNLIRDHGAVIQNLSYADPITSVRLERQLEAIAQKMDKVAIDLDELGA